MPTFSQDGRKMRVTTPLGPDVLLLERYRGEEVISAPFAFTLDMVSEDDAIDATKLIRKPMTLELELASGETRPIHGLVRRFVQLGQAGALTNYRAEVVPWLWFLSLSQDCRIFQEMKTPEILTKVFKDLGFSDFRDACVGSYAKRDYCVQYRESHLAFVSRLMEEEGIYYFFEHEASKHTLVLADAKSAVKPCPEQGTARWMPDAGPSHGDDVVLHVQLEQVALPGKVAVTDYNFETPAANLLATSVGDGKGELYDYPGDYAHRDAGEGIARRRLEAYEVPGKLLRGGGTCRAFQAGYSFRLEGHYRRDSNGDYLITSVTHEGDSGGYGTDRGSDDADYRNSFTCIPSSVPYRPARTTPQPIVHGSQTAVVVGKSGEEIWVDKYGRVKVQFHWDREGKKDEKSSCWVRVSSTWAGKQWGAIQLPRIGQEVIVDFLEGDPDRPIITGRVYNADQMPPYDLPANQTQSGVKTRSSKGGGTADFNELRFEDKKGEELLYIHAQRDQQNVVEHDDTLEIGNDQTRTIKRDRTTTIERDETVTVKGERKETVDKDETITISGKRTESVDGDETITIKGKRTESVTGKESLDLKDARETKVGMDDKLKVGMNLESKADMNVKLEAGLSMELKAGLSIKLSAGPASIELGPSGVTIKGPMIMLN